jgi:hypothetical protein
MAGCGSANVSDLGVVAGISGAADAKPIAIRATGSGEFRPWLALLLELPIRS